MKRCPICSAYASNDATTCFDCLYSFEHLTSLEKEAPTKKSDRVERIKVPVKPPSARKPATGSAETQPRAHTKAQVAQSTGVLHPPTEITITIRCNGADVRVEERTSRPQN